MTTTKTLTKTQFKTAAAVLSLAILSEDGWVSEYDARNNGAHLPALRALVDKGILETRIADFVMPKGPYAGQTFQETWYSGR